MIDLKFIGVGGAYAINLGGNCAYLKDKDSLLLIDCCEDATLKLKEKNVFNNVKNIILAITHTHSDHVAGIGTLIWYSIFLLGIKPKIIKNSQSFELHMRNLLNLLGVEEKFFEFVEPSNLMIDEVNIKMVSTKHTPMLESFGIMFSDNEGNYYYSGDTNDFENIKNLVCDQRIKKVYCEASWKSYNAHIEYQSLKNIKCDKLVLMHFEDDELYKLAQNDGFNVAQISVVE